MDFVTNYVSLTFIICILVTLGFIHYAVVMAAQSKKAVVPVVVMTAILMWFLVITYAANQGFFKDFVSFPPRLIIYAAFLLLVILTLFVIGKFRYFILRMPLTTLTYIHIVRIPVEIVLWWLFLRGMVPAEITFEGLNYDIISGISAPFAALFLIDKKSKNLIPAILWNLIALGLLINVVVRAIAATPYFINPKMVGEINIAVFEFPYIFLPLFVVPAVLFSHLASLYILTQKKETW